MTEGKEVTLPGALTLKFKGGQEIIFRVNSDGSQLFVGAGVLSVGFPAHVKSITQITTWLGDVKRFVAAQERDL